MRLNRYSEVSAGSCSPRCAARSRSASAAARFVEFVHLINDARCGPRAPILKPPVDVARRGACGEDHARVQFGCLVEQTKQPLLPFQVARHRIGIVHAQHAAAFESRKRLRRQRERAIQGKIGRGCAARGAHRLKQMRFPAAAIPPQPDRFPIRAAQGGQQFGVRPGEKLANTALVRSLTPSVNCFMEASIRRQVPRGAKAPFAKRSSHSATRNRCR